MYMKVLQITFLLIFVSFFCQAQNCVREGEFFGAVDVAVSGGATIEIQENGILKLTLDSNFRSDIGPDLDIYMGSQERVDDFSIKVEARASLKGRQSYDVFSKISMNDFDYITIWCTRYSHYYGSAKLEVQQGECILSKKKKKKKKNNLSKDE